ncbi:hypothetical protein [Umboniibacter marinipuniceus]|uniref:Uncharacterized protein n=1 Tax=Umboniibacter marinipuniceus TaxID=569599 RepID=A0A3M0ACP8_9GAMM|nr:hypothetical protein [Umboniibacter marinipuniceus]RMA80235.1 hypothetical protein DFR27_1599 [Umboniibacter marinipuniceus]
MTRETLTQLVSFKEPVSLTIATAAASMFAGFFVTLFSWKAWVPIVALYGLLVWLFPANREDGPVTARVGVQYLVAMGAAGSVYALLSPYMHAFLAGFIWLSAILYAVYYFRVPKLYR